MSKVSKSIYPIDIVIYFIDINLDTYLDTFIQTKLFKYSDMSDPRKFGLFRHDDQAL